VNIVIHSFFFSYESAYESGVIALICLPSRLSEVRMESDGMNSGINASRSVDLPFSLSTVFYFQKVLLWPSEFLLGKASFMF
jgi:hypothetical protein